MRHFVFAHNVTKHDLVAPEHNRYNVFFRACTPAYEPTLTHTPQLLGPDGSPLLVRSEANSSLVAVDGALTVDWSTPSVFELPLVDALGAAAPLVSTTWSPGDPGLVSGATMPLEPAATVLYALLDAPADFGLTAIV
jgi:hypothetical protein